MQNAIIQACIANVVFLLLLTMTIIFFALPRIQLFEDNKAELEATHQELQNIQKKGLSFQEMTKEVTEQGYNQNIYIRTLMRNIDNQFYQKNFTNTWSEMYTDFLVWLEASIEERKNSQEYIDKDAKLWAILPVYSDGKPVYKTVDTNNQWEEEVQKYLITDLDFTNYIEKLIYSFNLSADGEIGVWDIERLEDGLSSGTSQNKQKIEADNLEESIYKIPLNFDIVWQKWDVVDFLHFFENVWSVSISWDKLTIYSDNFILKVLEGERNSSTYNIYEHQIADIEYLEIEDYPDSSSIPNKEKNLIATMKWQQSRDKLAMSVELSFYVAGVPGYQMEKHIQEFIESVDTLWKNLSQDTKKFTIQAHKYNDGTKIQALQSLQSLDLFVLSLQKDINKMRQALAKKDDIPKLYNEVLEYSTQIQRVDKIYKTQKALLLEEK